MCRERNAVHDPTAHNTMTEPSHTVSAAAAASAPAPVVNMEMVTPTHRRPHDAASSVPSAPVAHGAPLLRIGGASDSTQGVSASPTALHRVGLSASALSPPVPPQLPPPQALSYDSGELNPPSDFMAVVHALQHAVRRGTVVRDSVGLVVEAYQVALRVARAQSPPLRAPQIDALVTRAVIATVEDAMSPVVRHLPSIMAAIRTGSVLSKQSFAQSRMELSPSHSAVDAVLAAMRAVEGQVQRHTRRAHGRGGERARVSAATKTHWFNTALAEVVGDDAVLQRNTGALVAAGFVDEMIGMLKDDTALAADMTQQLHLTAAQVGAAVATRGVRWCCASLRA